VPHPCRLCQWKAVGWLAEAVGGCPTPASAVEGLSQVSPLTTLGCDSLWYSLSLSR